MVIGGEDVRTGDRSSRSSRTTRTTCSHRPPGRRRGGGARDRRRRRGLARTGRACRGRSAPRSSCAPPSCSPARGAPTLIAATMLGQSKTVHQAEIDAACELIDFLRFNVEFMPRIYEEQPISSPGVWNRLEYRPLEGFVFAVTPFNFTAIGGNLPSSAGADGQHGRLEAGGDGGALGLLRHAPASRRPACPTASSTSSTGRARRSATRRSPARASRACTSPARPPSSRACGGRSAQNIDRYANYPRIVGETGGKDFILAHPSADVDAVATAIVRGAFEYQGQKCSAASRIYAPSNLWPALRDRLAEEVPQIRMGDVADFSNFMGAVIDAKALKSHREAIEQARSARRHGDPRRRRRRRLGGLLRRADRDRRPPTRRCRSCARSSSGRS